MNKINKKLLVVTGPTASGKSSLSIALAKRFSGEIVSADSMQIYSGMHIATAAVDEAEKQGIPHHLTEIFPVSTVFSVAEYSRLARKTIEEIHIRGKLPILTGGSGLYIDAVTENIDYFEEQSDYSVREKLKIRLKNDGAKPLLKELFEIDPETAERLHENDSGRIIRALEVYYLTGETMSKKKEKSRITPSEYENLIIGLNFSDRKILYDRIDKRVDEMVEKGLIKEAENFFSALPKDLRNTAVQAIGYKELLPYFEEKATLEDAISLLKQKTRNYAKRQLTWLNKKNDIHWIMMDGLSKEEIINISTEIVGNFTKV